MEETIMANVVFNFHNDTVLVTGGTRGLGFGISKKFVESGAEVIALYLNDDDAAQKAVAELSKIGKFTAVKADVSDEDRMIEVFKGIEKVDYLINCAGISYEDDIVKLPMKDVRAVFETQIFGKIIACKCAFPLLKKSNHPRVVNLASRFATKPLPGAIPLCASEASIVMFTKTLAMEWAEHGIRVNSVSPSLTVGTGSFYAFYSDEDAEREGLKNPIGRLGKMEDTANAVAWLCSDAADYVNGENINVSGGILYK